FTGGRTFFGMKRAKADVRAARAGLHAFEEQTLLDTVTQYFNVVRDTATVQINRNNVEVLKRELEASQDRFDVGEITRTDVAQAEARLSLGQTQLTAAEARLVASRSAYASAVGHLPGNLETRPELPSLPDSEATALTMAEKGNPQLRQAIETE